MSESAKSASDIDDVLSSIRRLVSETPTETMSAGPFMRPVTGDAGAGRLVLTPALRVTDTGPDAADATAGTDTQDGAEAPDTRDPAVTGPGEIHGDLPSPDQDSVAEAAMFDGLAEADLDEGDQDDGAEAPVASHGPAEVTFLADRKDPDRGGTDDIMADIAALTAYAPEAEAGVETTGEDAGDTDDLGMAEELGLTDAAEETEAETGDDMNFAEDDAGLDGSDTTDETAGGTDISSGTAEDTEPLQERDEAADVWHAAAADISGGGDETDAARPVGSDGWRPEMRLFDWDATESMNETADTGGGAVSEFESDLGDANWPDAASNRALLDLAAARGASATSGRVVFSRSARGAAGHTAASDTSPADNSGAEADGAPSMDSAQDGPRDSEYETEAGMPTPPIPDDELERIIAGPDADAADDALAPSTDDMDELEDAVLQRTAAKVSVLMGGARSGAAQGDDAGPVDDMDAAEADMAPSEFGGLDEAALRRIVADVVREELRGALGQRITRNVRKLVRREIRLLLAADELD